MQRAKVEYGIGSLRETVELEFADDMTHFYIESFVKDFVNKKVTWSCDVSQEIPDGLKTCPLCKGKGTNIVIDAIEKGGSLINPRSAVCMACDGVGKVVYDVVAECWEPYDAKRLAAPS